ncbi:hypothetical protein SAY87_027516 [Trapa incisa]|uniref:Expansin n=1 Tax=Trapa incisa TaxID=236973 RepID=A0AAN7JMN7_9MYRT|nr:hypothetical protein SAY87_027516 [Trapa incisa]
MNMVMMRSQSQAQSCSVIPFVLLALTLLTFLQHSTANDNAGNGGIDNTSGGHVGPNVVRKRGLVVHHVHPHGRHLSTNLPGPWKQAHATFYQGSSQSFGGACGYKDVEQQGYGTQTAALSSALFKDGQTCGACYEIKCVNDPQWCQTGHGSLKITATNHCPPNYQQSGDNGGWCNPPREHFDIAQPAFKQLAKDYKAGIIPITYRRVPCHKKGGIKFTISGNPYFNEVVVWNVGGAGEVVALQVKGDKTQWTAMKRLWGQKWETDAMLVGQSLSFRVTAADGRKSTSYNITPSNWQFGQTFEGKNFK